MSSHDRHAGSRRDGRGAPARRVVAAWRCAASAAGGRAAGQQPGRGWRRATGAAACSPQSTAKPLGAQRDLALEREPSRGGARCLPDARCRSADGGAEWLIEAPDDALALLERLPTLPMRRRHRLAARQAGASRGSRRRPAQGAIAQRPRMAGVAGRGRDRRSAGDGPRATARLDAVRAAAVSSRSAKAATWH